MNLYKEICNKINGRFAMSEQDAELLRRMIIHAGDGNYIEIGTLYGASAIFAALVKKEHNISGGVYAIDPMTGYYGGWDSLRQVTEDDFYQNANTFNVHISLIKELSYPFPLNVPASLILIDGNHDIDYVKKDWESAKKYSNIVIFHDYNDPPIREFVNSISDYKIIESIETMAVLERTENAD